MPGTTDDAGKRKRQENGEQTKKRRKSGGADESEQLQQIPTLEAEILESRKNYNNIATLIQYVENWSEDPKTARAAAESLCRVFIQLLALGKLVKKKELSEKDATLVSWLRGWLSDYEAALVSMLETKRLGSKALILAMSLVKAEALHLKGGNGISFPEAFFQDIIGALFVTPIAQLREEFSESFFTEFDDIRFHTLHATRVFLANETVSEDVRNNVLELLLSVEDVPDSNEDLEDFFIATPTEKKDDLLSLSKHKKQAEEAWLAFMRQGLSKDQRKKVLEVMESSIAPWFTRPEQLMDFLTDCYNSGGSTSLLALSGVYYLERERNLKYPDFYKKLYSLLDADMLHSKHRSRFFRLLDTFLGSSHLPAVLVASFMKRLARLALNAPPSAIVAIVPWFYNIFKKHPTTTFMMHRVPRTKEEKDLIESEGVDDPFLPDEEDPMETRALDSCIWEIVQLQSHYHPNVATIAKIVSEQFTKQAYNIEDFLDHSYGSLLDAEMTKTVKKAPVVEYVIPKRIFTKAEAGTEEKDSLLVNLWDFSS
ncbi:CBF/Mak21 family domain containing protein [Rhypophila decipiens]